ncbi:MAG: hypothetical protein ACFUZC_14350 [Chthoniobacteraceae bacterium]
MNQPSKSLLMAALFVPILSPHVRGEAPMRHQAAHLLRSDSLTVEVMDPNLPERYNTGVRFSPVANVLRVVADGRDFLFSPVPHQPQTDNCGLAMEFDVASSMPPPGFAEAAPGEGFLKIGVGVLRKAGEAYDFYKNYEPIALAKSEATWNADSAHFEQVCPAVNGYAYQLSADIRVEGKTLEVRYRLVNTGSRAFTTEQYTHNFLTFGEAPVGAGYTVEFPRPVAVTGRYASEYCTQNGIEFRAPFPPKVKAMNFIIAPIPGEIVESHLVARDKSNGSSVKASVSLPPARVVIHVSPRYLCPEQFVRIDLAPGKAATWTRRFDFQIEMATPAPAQ